MSRVRWVQSGLLLLLLIGGWVSCNWVGESPKAPLIQWTPAGSTVEQVTTRLEKTPREAAPPAEDLYAFPPAPTPAPIAVPAPPPVPAPPAPPPAPEFPLEPELAALLEEPPAPPPPAPPAPEIKKPAVPVRVESWPAAGPEVAEGLAKVLAAQDQSSLGYRPNDLIVGKLLGDGTSQQRGELYAVQEYLKFLVAKSAPSPAANQVKAALLDGNLEKWWFPSAEKTLSAGTAALTEMAKAMRGSAVMPGDPATLKGLLALTDSLLAGEEKVLSGSTAAYLALDDRFYHARGVAAVADETVRGSLTSFGAVVDNRGLRADLAESLQWLAKAAAMAPVIVMGGDMDDLSSNHLLILAYALDRSQTALRRAADKLE